MFLTDCQNRRLRMPLIARSWQKVSPLRLQRGWTKSVMAAYQSRSWQEVRTGTSIVTAKTTMFTWWTKAAER